MKYILLFLSVGVFVNDGSAQDQEMAYRFGFVFQKTRLESNGTLWLIDKRKVKNVDTLGYLSKDTCNFVINTNEADQPDLKKRTIHKRLKGIITKRNKDSLFIKFWDILGENTKSSFETGNVRRSDNQKQFVYVLDSARGWNSPGPSIIPFRFSQLMATSLPFRVLIKSGKLESDFLNANIAWLFVRGHTKLFKSEFVKPRNRYIAVGPYLGLSSIDNEVKATKEFGLNYGINVVGAVQGLNLTVAYGFQNGFSSTTRSVQPYLGFGIGIKLVETFAPEIKDGDE